MPIYHGSNRIAALYHGSTAIGRVYQGSTLVYDSAAAGTEPAFWSRVHRTTLNTTTGNQTISIPGLSWTPKAVKFTVTSATADATPNTEARGGFGVTDGTNSWAIGWAGQGFGPGGAARVSKIGSCIMTATGDGTYAIEFEASFISFGPGSVTINITNAWGGGRLLTVEFFGGSSLSVHAGTASLGAQDVAVPVDMGFTPNAVFFGSAGPAFSGTAGTFASSTFGFASYDGTTLRQVGTSHFYNTPGGTRDSRSIIRPNAVHPLVSNTIYTEMSINPGTGFSLTSRNGGMTTNATGWLALSFGGAAQAWAGVMDSPTSTGDQTLSGPSFTPSYAVLQTERMTAVDTTQGDGQGYAFSLSPITSDAQFCNHWRNTDNFGSGGTVDDFAEADSKAINTSDHRSLYPIDATFVGWTSGGMTLNFTNNVSGLKWPVMFIG